MIKMTHVPISVTLMDEGFHIGDQLHLAIKAWMTSRPNITNPTPNQDILKIDAPVTDFIHIPLLFKVPNYIREVVVSLRDHIAWSTTTRVAPIDKEWFVWNPGDRYSFSYGELAKDLLNKKESGATQDQFRMNLPLGYVGEFCAKISFRSLIKLVLFLQMLEAKSAESSFGLVINEIYKVLEKIELRKEFELALENADYIEFMSFNFPNRVDNPVKMFRTGRFIRLQGNFPISFRTHIIRHRSLHVDDGLANRMISYRSLIPVIPIKDVISLEAVASEAVWHHVINTRACWIAQGELWNNVVQEYVEISGKNTPPLPCDNGKCPVEPDNVARFEGNDPNPPCPIWIDNLRKPITEEVKAHILVHGQSKPNWWNTKIVKVTG